jgi:hypothetical protein
MRIRGSVVTLVFGCCLIALSWGLAGAFPGESGPLLAQAPQQGSPPGQPGQNQGKKPQGSPNQNQGNPPGQAKPGGPGQPQPGGPGQAQPGGPGQPMQPHPPGGPQGGPPGGPPPGGNPCVQSHQRCLMVCGGVGPCVNNCNVGFAMCMQRGGRHY